MTSSGSYSEKLPCGGSLHVSKHDWSIFYYFSGPDARYNGTHFTIAGRNIEELIQALQENWSEFLKLVDKTPAGGTFSKDGKMGMKIAVGEHLRGVYLHRHFKLQIRSEQDKEGYINSYRYAVGRAQQIQAFLASI